jgi:hypothetical protein
MLSWIQEAAKVNPFSSPFTTVKCQASENSVQSLVPNRQIIAAAVEEDRSNKQEMRGEGWSKFD